mmetsp:Transcript_56902/g.122485  ORF Transcript_56902/g.122485 Transcript_56902/m.122485 type:complete len:206 (+) Transcript_56902:460-1077(+)
MDNLLSRRGCGAPPEVRHRQSPGLHPWQPGALGEDWLQRRALLLHIPLLGELHHRHCRLLGPVLASMGTDEALNACGPGRGAGAALVLPRPAAALIDVVGCRARECLHLHGGRRLVRARGSRGQAAAGLLFGCFDWQHCNGQRHDADGCDPDVRAPYVRRDARPQCGKLQPRGGSQFQCALPPLRGLLGVGLSDLRSGCELKCAP